MNRPRPRARVVVRARDPLLRSLIAERLSGLEEIAVQEDGARTPGARGEDGGMEADAVVEVMSAAPGLTPREMEVLGLLADGLANKEIGARLGISAHTAKFHVESLLRKLDAANRAEAVREGIGRGLIGV
ncbi:MAG: helix-turn-helix transcriptional regulator [Spirochaetia bacterium]|jgi:DNA-binding CsgD family transcriptional regulator